MTPQARLRAIAWCVLALGFASAIAIYLYARPPGDDPLGDPTESKRYLHDLELYGGKANVLQDEFRRWFHGLWQGKQLASTVAFLSALAFLALRFLAGPGRRPVDPLENTETRTGPGGGRLHLVDRDFPRPPGATPDTDADSGERHRS